jgi:hypothetical protein
MGSGVEKQAREKVESFRKGIAYLDSCGDNFTYENFREADRIAGGNTSETEARAMWSQAQLILPSAEHRGGGDAIRHMLRNTFEEGLRAFGTLVDRLGTLPSESKPKKGFAFWRKNR